MNDSIFNQQLTTNLMKIEAGHIEKESKAKLNTQNKILALNEDIIERQKYLNIFVGIVTLLLIALTIILLWTISAILLAELRTESDYILIRRD